MVDPEHIEALTTVGKYADQVREWAYRDKHVRGKRPRMTKQERLENDVIRRSGTLLDSIGKLTSYWSAVVIEEQKSEDEKRGKNGKNPKDS